RRMSCGFWSSGRTGWGGTRSPPQREVNPRRCARSSPAPSRGLPARSVWTIPMTAEQEPHGNQPTPPGEPAAATVLALMIDQGPRAQRGAPLRVETYLEKHPGLRDDREGLLDLIYNEIILREGRGESPALPEYQARFPDVAAALGDLFEVHRAIEQEM